MATKGLILTLSLAIVFLANMKDIHVVAVSGDVAEVVVKHQKEFLARATECKIKVGATDEDVMILMSRTKLPETRTGECMIACIMENMHLMKDGKYLEASPQMMMQHIVGPGCPVAELVGDVSKVCAKTIASDDDNCKTAKKIVECGLMHVKKFKEVTNKKM